MPFGTAPWASLASDSAACTWIAQDKFGTADETRLDLEQLTQLRNTLAARSRSRARRQAAAA